MRVHIQGMGLQGCLLAASLGEDMDLTWYDPDVPQTAWRASTGAIYPADSTKFGDDRACWLRWQEWFDNGGFPSNVLSRHPFYFNHKKPPHEGKYVIEDRTPGGLGRAADLAYHLNAQALVPMLRKSYRAGQVFEPWQTDADVTICAYPQHRVHHYYWGWTRLVELEYDPRVFPGDERPSIYLREGRFIMAYAYPVPGTPYWYAGSNIIKQAAPKSLDMVMKYARWKANFERLAGGDVRVGHEGQYLEGWRPAAAPGDQEWARWAMVSGRRVLSLRPLWNSGIRHFPQQLDSVMHLIKEKLT